MTTRANDVNWTPNTSDSYLRPAPANPASSPATVNVGLCGVDPSVSYTHKKRTFTVVVGPNNAGASCTTRDTDAYARVHQSGVNMGLVRRTDCVIL